MDWAGKEVLQWLRVWLTARYGWWDPDSGERPGLQWEGLSRSRWGAQDRPVETALRPLLVARLVAYVTGLTDGDIYDEWSELEKALRAWKALV
jgi:hypothetical protein